MPHHLTPIPAAQYQRSTWKNGLGHTDQIAIHPPGADLKRGDFDWRLSTARIERSSPFSPFPAHDRVLVVVSQNTSERGVRLTHDFDGDREQVDLSPLEPYEFPGDVPTHCELMGEAIQDLSVFARSGIVSPRASVVEIGAGTSHEWQPSAHVAFAYVARGDVSTHEGELGAGDTLRVELEPDGEPVMLESSQGATVVLVELETQT